MARKSFEGEASPGKTGRWKGLAKTGNVSANWGTTATGSYAKQERQGDKAGISNCIEPEISKFYVKAIRSS